MGSQLSLVLTMRLTLALVLTTLTIVAEGNPKPMTVKANVAVKVKSDTPDIPGVYGGRAQGSGCTGMKLFSCMKKLAPKIKACDDPRPDKFYPCLYKIRAGEMGDCQDCWCLLLKKVNEDSLALPYIKCP